MKIRFDEDGRTHINIYSKGKTQLGRFLSNFTFCPIKTEDGHFDSIEGYWYWLSCKSGDKDKLRKCSGAEAKDLGRSLGASDWTDDLEFKRKIKRAITIKLESRPEMLRSLKETKLPLTHYYVYGEKMVKVPGAKWILDHIESLKGLELIQSK